MPDPAIGLPCSCQPLRENSDVHCIFVSVGLLLPFFLLDVPGQNSASLLLFSPTASSTPPLVSVLFIDAVVHVRFDLMPSGSG